MIGLILLLHNIAVSLNLALLADRSRSSARTSSTFSGTFGKGHSVVTFRGLAVLVELELESLEGRLVIAGYALLV